MKKIKDWATRFVLRAGTILGGAMFGFAALYILLGLISGYQSADGTPATTSETISGIISMLILFGVPGALLLFASKSARKRIYGTTKKKNTPAKHVPITPHPAEPVVETPTYEESVAETPAAPSAVAVKCPNCGGMNMVLSGTAGECEYCGSPLNA